ncbi:MAG: MFS transporter [Acidobacteria bacterium]|nr:MFS transporter [Acidobacteriota bacterium]
MKRNLSLLAICQALAFAGTALVASTSALVGARLAPTPTLATLALSTQFLATMLTTLPASMLMQRIGRRRGFTLGAMAGVAGGLMSAAGIVTGNFALFCIGAAGIGIFGGFSQYYRLAAADSVTPEQSGPAISLVLSGGVAGAFLGPIVATWTYSPEATPFARTYVALAGLYALSILFIVLLRANTTSTKVVDGTERPLAVILRQPLFVMAAVAATLGFSIMTLIMTATPLAMNAHDQSFERTAVVIQWHLVAMFAPSFFPGHLIRRFGATTIIVVGALLDVICVAINLSGTNLMNFWASLVILGIAWNFLYTGGSTLLTETYQPAERARVQGIHSLFVFIPVTAVSLGSGALHHFVGWRGVNFAAAPLIVAILATTWWFRRGQRHRFLP